MDGKIISTILRKGQRFPGIGSLLTFWPFRISLRNVTVPVSALFSMLMYYNECMMRLRSRGIHAPFLNYGFLRVCAQ